MKITVKSYYETYLLGKTIINEEKRIAIKFVKSGIKHLLNYKKQVKEQLIAVAILDKMIEGATYKNFKEPDADDGNNVLGYLNFRITIRRQGKNIPFRIVIRLMNNGKFYYHHSFRKKETLP